MAAGTSRIVRYVLFAFFVSLKHVLCHAWLIATQGIIILYFVSSSSMPRPTIPDPSDFTGKWHKDAKDAGAASGEIHSPQASSEASSAPAPVSPKPSGGLPTAPADGERMNATFVTLARNSDLWDIVKSIRQVEDRFNRNYNYGWVFLNDKPFDATFKKVTSALISGKTYYGEIPEEHWSFPEHIDQDKAQKVREDMAQKKIIYGDSVSYRHMCRFESGFFFRHPLMNQFEWYWRVEPSIELYCDIGYDTFKYMRDHGKKYSFVLSLYEYVETIPTLWDSVKGFMKEHPEHIAEGNSMKFLSDDGGKTYNHCHFVSPIPNIEASCANMPFQWSNFEIGNLDWLRSQAYLDYFDKLDKDGGFFYERWGDAPVHSVAAGLLLKKEEIHFFNDIAYYHVPFTHCPTDEQLRLDNKCHCRPSENFDWKGYSCKFSINAMNFLQATLINDFSQVHHGSLRCIRWKSRKAIRTSRTRYIC